MLEDDRNTDLPLRFSSSQEGDGDSAGSLSMDEIEEILAEIRF